VSIFTAGKTIVSLEEATKIVLGQFAEVKAKTRRLYDIANILVSVGLVIKLKNYGPKSASGVPRRPAFQWTGRVAQKYEDAFREAARGNKTPTPPTKAPAPTARGALTRSHTQPRSQGDTWIPRGVCMRQLLVRGSVCLRSALTINLVC